MNNINVQIRVYYLDPMSYNNMAIYDYNLLTNIIDIKCDFWGSDLYSYKKIDIHPVFNYSKKKQPFKTLSYLISTINIFFRARRNANVVHFQWLRLYTWDYLMMRLLKLCGVKIVLTAHNTLPHDSGLIHKKIFLKIYNACDAIISHTPDSSKELVNLGVKQNKIHVIPHGTLEIPSNEEPSELIKSFYSNSSKDQKYVFSFLGMIKDYKGIEFLVDLANWIDDNKIPACIIVAGKGSHDSLKKMGLCKSVHIHNEELSDADFKYLLKNSSALLLPYKAISQSGLLLTSIAEKVPVIASPIEGFKYVFDIEKPGIMMKEITAEALCVAVQEFICNSEKQVISWEKLNNAFNWGAIGKQTTQLYKRVLCLN